MMTVALQKTQQNLEQVLIGGDLAKLSPAERTTYYARVCESLGLNPLTKPFEYITLNGRLTLYARKDCADQLRRIYGVSIDKPDISFQDDWIVVTVAARLPDGRTDSDIGVVSRKDMRGDFGNALMKAVTKAKRRVTLSVCGLGMLDETEVESITTAAPAPAPEPPRQIEAPRPVAPPAAAPPAPAVPPPAAAPPHDPAELSRKLEKQLRDADGNGPALMLAWSDVDTERRAGRITKEQFAHLQLVKDRCKARLAPQTPEVDAGLIDAQIERVATAIGAEYEVVLRELCERYKCGCLDDLTTEQLKDARLYLNTLTPGNQIFEPGPVLAGKR